MMSLAQTLGMMMVLDAVTYTPFLSPTDPGTTVPPPKQKSCGQSWCHQHCCSRWHHRPSFYQKDWEVCGIVTVENHIPDGVESENTIQVSGGSGSSGGEGGGQ